MTKFISKVTFDNITIINASSSPTKMGLLRSGCFYWQVKIDKKYDLATNSRSIWGRKLVKRHSGPPGSVGWLCRRVGGVRPQLLGQFPVDDGGAGAD